MLLADMLDRNGSIHHLDIAANQISHTSLLRIKSECKRRKATASSQEPRALQDQIRSVRVWGLGFGVAGATRTTGSDQVSCPNGTNIFPPVDIAVHACESTD
jgi:hypothetical protein